MARNRRMRRQAEPVPAGGRLGPAVAVPAVAVPAVAVSVIAGLLALGHPAARPVFPGEGGDPKPPLELLLGFDVSGSQSAQERQRLCGLMDEAVDAALPTGTRVRVWTFARDAESAYEGSPTRARDLWLLQDDVLKRTAPAGGGTRPASVLREMAGVLGLEGLRSVPAAAVLMWDGEDADPGATAPLVTALAGSPRLRTVWVAGVPSSAERPLRARVDRAFRPALGQRLVVSGPYDAAAGLEAFRQKIQGGR